MHVGGGGAHLQIDLGDGHRARDGAGTAVVGVVHAQQADHGARRHAVYRKGVGIGRGSDGCLRHPVHGVHEHPGAVAREADGHVHRGGARATNGAISRKGGRGRRVEGDGSRCRFGVAAGVGNGDRVGGGHAGGGCHGDGGRGGARAPVVRVRFRPPAHRGRQRGGIGAAARDVGHAHLQVDVLDLDGDHVGRAGAGVVQLEYHRLDALGDAVGKGRKGHHDGVLAGGNGDGRGQGVVIGTGRGRAGRRDGIGDVHRLAVVAVLPLEDDEVARAAFVHRGRRAGGAGERQHVGRYGIARREAVGFEEDRTVVNAVAHVAHHEADVVGGTGDDHGRGREDGGVAVELDIRHVGRTPAVALVGVEVGLVLQVVDGVDGHKLARAGHQGDVGAIGSEAAVDARPADEKAEDVVVGRVDVFAILFRGKHVVERHRVDGRREVELDAHGVEYLPCTQDVEVGIASASQVVTCAVGIVRSGCVVDAARLEDDAMIETDGRQAVGELAAAGGWPDGRDARHAEATAAHQHVLDEIGRALRGNGQIGQLGLVAMLAEVRAPRAIGTLDADEEGTPLQFVRLATHLHLEAFPFGHELVVVAPPFAGRLIAGQHARRSALLVQDGPSGKCRLARRHHPQPIVMARMQVANTHHLLVGRQRQLEAGLGAGTKGEDHIGRKGGLFRKSIEIGADRHANHQRDEGKRGVPLPHVPSISFGDRCLDRLFGVMPVNEPFLPVRSTPLVLEREKLPDQRDGQASFEPALN